MSIWAIIVLAILGFTGMGLYVLVQMSNPSPKRVKRGSILNYVLLFFCYVVVFIITVYKRDWKNLKRIKHWQF